MQQNKTKSYSLTLEWDKKVVYVYRADCGVLWHRFDPWSGNVHKPLIHQKKKKKKKRLDTNLDYMPSPESIKEKEHY